jgi:putative flippase GtrA
LDGDIVQLGGITMTRYIAAYIISFFVSFPIGFFLSKFVVFQESHLKGRIQLFRYAALQGFNIILNYSLLHFFAGFCGFWATPSQTLTTVIIAVFSYFFQRHVSFRTKKEPAIAGLPAEEEEQ